MEYIKDVIDLSEQFVKNASYVSIDDAAIKKLSSKIKEATVTKKIQGEHFFGEPKIPLIEGMKKKELPKWFYMN